MKKSINPIKSTLFILLAAACLTATAQKLPNVQPAGVRAPDNIKIDGKTTEWDNQFQAYNHATDIFYTVSNDDTHLYLTIQATESAIMSKIMGGGITFTVQKSAKKNDKDGVSITYPIFEKNNRPSIGVKMNMNMENGVTKTTTTSDPVTDSLVMARNKQLDEKSKVIGVTGIPGLDTLISVYNEDGIKTGERFNKTGAYIYELSVDLKLLGISVADASKFAYHIKLNGTSFGTPTIKVQGGDGSAAYAAATAAATEQIMAKLSAMMGPSATPTDFWGDYTLAKK
jgi:hypothetical protein